MEQPGIQIVADEMASGLVQEMSDGTDRSISRSESLADLLIQSLAGKVVALLENASPSNSLSDESFTSRLQKAERKLERLTDDSEDENDDDEREGSRFPNLKYAKPKCRNVESVLKYAEGENGAGGVKLVIMTFND